MTSIQVEHQLWWSLGLEAFGDEATIEHTLLLGARKVFADDQPPTLSPSASYGYPRWLQLLEQGGTP